MRCEFCLLVLKNCAKMTVILLRLCDILYSKVPQFSNNDKIYSNGEIIKPPLDVMYLHAKLAWNRTGLKSIIGAFMLA